MKVIALCACLMLAACAGEHKKDYEASARCYELGFKSGTPEYDKCVKEEIAIRQLNQQREQYDRYKREQHNWILPR